MTIGHNAPPPFEALSLQIEELFALVSDSTAGGQVSTDEQEAALDGLLDDFRKVRKEADAARVEEKRPHDDAAKAVQAKWKPVLDRCDAAANEIKRLLTPYRTAKQAAKDEAARKAREEAEQRQREAEAALRQSDCLEDRFEAEAALKQAGKLVAVANRIDREATGLRTHWDAEITDRKAALKFYLNRNPEVFIEAMQRLADADARGARPMVPGVIYHERKVAA
jgi:hypothetical protein